MLLLVIGALRVLLRSGRATVDAVPAAIGDVAQFLDVDMHHLTGVGVLLAAHYRPVARSR